MLARSIAGSFNERTTMGTPKGVHEEGFSGLRAAFFPPNPLKGDGSPERTFYGQCKKGYKRLGTSNWSNR